MCIVAVAVVCQNVVYVILSISAWAHRVCSLTCDSQCHWHVALSLWFPFPTGRPVHMHPSLLAACENTGVTDPRIPVPGSAGAPRTVLCSQGEMSSPGKARGHCASERGRHSGHWPSGGQNQIYIKVINRQPSWNQTHACFHREGEMVRHLISM